MLEENSYGEMRGGNNDKKGCKLKKILPRNKEHNSSKIVPEKPRGLLCAIALSGRPTLTNHPDLGEVSTR